MKKLATVLLGLLFLFSAAACTETEKDYKISYAHAGQIYEIAVKDGSLYRIEELPQKAGHEFAGLFDAKSGGTQYIDETGVSVEAFHAGKNIVLYPQFTPKTYSFELDYRGGNADPLTLAVGITYGEEVAGLPFNVTQEDKRFLGWFTQTDGKGEQIADDKGVLASKKVLNEENYDLPDNGKIYLFAHYAEGNCKITFCYGDGYSDEISYAVRGALVRDVMPKKKVGDRYVLNWSTEPDDINKEHMVSSVSGDTVLYPCSYGFGIVFQTGEGERLPVSVLPAGENLSLPTPSREGYSFMGWETQEGNLFEASVMPSENLTLVARWKKDATKITFDVNGGTPVEPVTANEGETIQLPETQRDGYSFAGWYRADGNLFTATVMPRDSLTLTARWYKRQSFTRTLTNGTKSVSSSKTGMLFTIDLSEYLAPEDTTEISLRVSYNLKVKSYIFIGAPTWFDFKFYSRNEVNDAYKFGDAVCRWSGEYGNVSNASMSTNLTGNKIYIAADSNTWAPGYEISNFAVTITFTEHRLV